MIKTNYIICDWFFCIIKIVEKTTFFEFVTKL